MVLKRRKAIRIFDRSVFIISILLVIYLVFNFGQQIADDKWNNLIDGSIIETCKYLLEYEN